MFAGDLVYLLIFNFLGIILNAATGCSSYHHHHQNAIEFKIDKNVNISAKDQQQQNQQQQLQQLPEQQGKGDICWLSNW